KKYPKALEKDRAMAYYRKNLDWENEARTAIDPQKVREGKKIKKTVKGKPPCTMCGEFCTMKVEL
ncbi:phosphomethylpyrimidine synthase ThiC, partial [Candidatus Poribacteria bacterium]|nr:phosphomethylpyrimidine synthase ThiC [Candidatus Poribacteria bacterium]